MKCLKPNALSLDLFHRLDNMLYFIFVLKLKSIFLLIGNHSEFADWVEIPEMKDTKTQLIRFTNCRILRGHKIIREDLWVRNGKIIDPEPVYYLERRLADISIDCKNLLIAPGYIDLQINGKYLICLIIN